VVSGERRAYASMDEVRAAIDSIDEQLMPLIAERAHCIVEAARLKGDPDVALVPWRVEEVAARVRTLAERHAMDPDLAERIWRAMMSEFIAHERRLMERAAER
jgi:isochorismate pyruvate lyase